MVFCAERATSSKKEKKGGNEIKKDNKALSKVKTRYTVSTVVLT
jgi:hypothetical protein